MNLSTKELQFRIKIICERKLDKQEQQKLDKYLSDKGMTYKSVYENYLHGDKNRYFVELDYSKSYIKYDYPFDRLVNGRYMRLTNFDTDRLLAYQNAITKYKKCGGSEAFFITSTAHYNYKYSIRVLPNHYALWTDNNSFLDLSEFWRLYEDERDLLYILGLAKPY